MQEVQGVEVVDADLDGPSGMRREDPPQSPVHGPEFGDDHAHAGCGEVLRVGVGAQSGLAGGGEVAGADLAAGDGGVGGEDDRCPADGLDRAVEVHSLTALEGGTGAWASGERRPIDGPSCSRRAGGGRGRGMMFCRAVVRCQNHLQKPV
ncbi:hypothetical protein [Streptomyces griseoflavus]|uniref:hypothetical protein n=1 Tax=Streptomyces griseoflavus TaxID=35619 RepID=UPI001319F65D|nr:hypothetical protein [Streptomyces griseoflavus]